MDYSRQELVLGRNEFHKKTVAIVGLGAIGSNSANILARSGLKLILIDKDIVEESNINSQSVYTKKDLNKPKALQIAKHLKELNKNIKIYSNKLSSKNIHIIDANLVLDCTDNIETRLILNDYCKKNNIPLIHSAAIKMLGTVFVSYKGPCLRCIYSNKAFLEDCSTSGILNTTASSVSSIQCNEALKILSHRHHEKNLLRINLEKNEITKVSIEKNCDLCANNRIDPKLIIKKCRDKGGYSVKQDPGKSLDLNSIKKHFKVEIETPIVLCIKEKNYEIIVHNYGELLFKNAENINEIKKIALEIYKNG